MKVTFLWKNKRCIMWLCGSLLVLLIYREWVDKLHF